MDNEFIKKLKASNLWDTEFKDMDDFIDNGLLKNEIIPELPKLIVNVVRTGDLMKAMGDNQLAKLGLSIPQKNVLEALYFSKKEYLTQAELSSFVYTSKANMSSLLERMEKKNFIKREENKQNKRQKKVILTKIGEKKYLELVAMMENYKEFHFEDIVSEEEAKIANKVLLKLKEFHKNFEKQLKN